MSPLPTSFWDDPPVPQAPTHPGTINGWFSTEYESWTPVMFCPYREGFLIHSLIKQSHLIYYVSALEKSGEIDDALVGLYRLDDESLQESRCWVVFRTLMPTCAFSIKVDPDFQKEVEARLLRRRSNKEYLFGTP